MSLVKIKPLSRKLIDKFGPLGVVASRYLLAGLHVEVNHPTRYGPIHVVAIGNGQRIAVEVFSEPRDVPRDVVERIALKAKLIKSKPVLALYGDGPKLGEEVRKLCSDLGVKVKRVRA